MAGPLRALLIEDSEDDALLLVRTLRRAGYQVTFERVDTPEAMRAALAHGAWDVVISDYVMPQFSAPAALGILKESKLDLPFIIVSGAIGEDTAVAAMRAGAHDYLMKDNLARLVPAIERELQEATNRRERRRAEELSARLGRILDNSSNEIFVCDATSLRFVQVNRGASSNLGYAPDELLQLTLLALQPELSAQRLEALLQLLRSGEREQVVYETVQRRRDGSTYPVEVRLHFSREENPPVFVAIVQNIAERKRAEVALRFLAEASTVLVSSIDYETTLANVTRLAVPALADWCAVGMLDGEQVLRQVAVAHAGLPEGEARQLLEPAQPPAAVPPPEFAGVLQGQARLLTSPSEPLLAALAQDPGQLEQLLQLQPCCCMLVPLVMRGRVEGMIAFASAANGQHYGPEHLALAEELARRAAVALDNARLYRETEQALHTRDQFLSIAAHELKTPITALMGYAQLMQRRAEREGSTNQRDLRTLLALTDQSRRLHRLITSLLDLARLQLGVMAIERGRVDLAALVRRMLEELEPTLERHTLVWSVPQDELILDGDELRLEQVLQNLLQNAIRYSPNGGQVHIEVEPCGERVRISVRDEGIGISAASVSRIFNRFYRAENADAQQIRGMGVGLYIVKEIVALHGGSIEVESVEGQGSTFTVWLPLAPTGALVSQELLSGTEYRPQ